MPSAAEPDRPTVGVEQCAGEDACGAELIGHEDEPSQPQPTCHRACPCARSTEGATDRCLADQGEHWGRLGPGVALSERDDSHRDSLGTPFVP